jgi:hypothetical protein
MATEYWKADDVAEIARGYLGMHPDLIGANIAYIFKTKASMSDGEPIVGKAMKVPDRYKCLMEETVSGDVGYDFIIEIGADAWQELNSAQKAAWVDHCLECCYGEEDKNGDIKWKMRKPSVRAFPVILNRHGTGWDAGVNRLSTLNLRQNATATEPVLRSPAVAEVAEVDTTSS